MVREPLRSPATVPDPLRLMLPCLSALLVLQACSFLPQPKVRTFETQQDAGRIMVGTQTVAPFEDYIDALQPRFELTTESALAQAIPQTQSVRLRELRSLAVALQLAFPDAAAGGADVENGSETPQAPDTSVPEPAQRGLDVLAALDPATLETDPMLRYRAATALYQEVALLSSYVRDAAVNPGTVPYIVRQLVTVLPSARRAPYDVHLSIAYFSADPRPLPTTLYSSDPYLETPNDDPCQGTPVRVIPLFVTDSIETSLVQADRAGDRDIGFSTTGASTAVGFGLGVRSRQESAEESVSRELNSILTIGRAADNVLSLRIGAAAVDNTYHLVARTFNVTALVLAPAIESAEGVAVLPCRKVRYSLQAELSDARTGEKLPTTPPAAIARRLSESLDLGEADAVRLLDAAIGNEFERFRCELAAGRRTELETDRLWLQFVRASSSAGWGAGTFELPASLVRFFVSSTVWQRNGEEIVERPRVAIVDDGKTATLRLTGARGLSEGTIDGSIEFAAGRLGEVELLASTVKVEGGGRGATITFPSVLKVSPSASAARVVLHHSPRLHRWSPDPRGLNYWEAELPILDVRGEKPPERPGPEFEVQVSSDQVRVTSAGRGQLALTFRRAKKPEVTFRQVYFSLHGGHVLASSPVLTQSDGAHQAYVDSIYTLDLGGLVPGGRLRLEAWRPGAKPGERIAVPAQELYVVGPEPGES